jgi:hypothetical protein
MDAMSRRNGFRRVMLVKQISEGALIASTPSACTFDDVPSCPGQCFVYTVEQPSPSPCRDDGGTQYLISFTAHDPDGYSGRACFNSSSVPLVVQAIDHLGAGGQLAELGMDVQNAYLSTVDTVRADLEAECIAAAPDQCTNAALVCSVIGSVAYQQLVIDETCVLGLDGTEPVALGPGQLCEPVVGDDGTGSDGSEAHCVEATVSGDDGLDDTASSGLADDTTGWPSLDAFLSTLPRLRVPRAVSPVGCRRCRGPPGDRTIIGGTPGERRGRFGKPPEAAFLLQAPRDHPGAAPWGIAVARGESGWRAFGEAAC